MSTSTTATLGGTVSPHHGVSEAVHISSREQVSRAAAISSANGHNAMEGLFSSSFSQGLQKRYVNGDIDIDDAIQAARRHYGAA